MKGRDTCTCMVLISSIGAMYTCNSLVLAKNAVGAEHSLQIENKSKIASRPSCIT